MEFIITHYQPEEYKLKLQTCERNDIENIQRRYTRGQYFIESSYIEKQYPLAKFKGTLTPYYNCHGLTFASRRTRIENSLEVEKILKDDKYIEIKNEEDVLPGDIITYHDHTGITHSGLVIRVDLPATHMDMISITIFSKWGSLKEVIHNANYSVYSNGIKRYWRINHGFTII